MRFANPTLFHLLWLIPLVCLLYVYAKIRRRQALSRLGDPLLVGRLSRSLSRKRRGQKSFLLLAGLALILVSMARPQYGTKVRVVEREGVDIVVALDVSKSMLAEDVKPSRLARAKSEVSSLIDKLRGDRIGLVAFAGDAFIQCPLTLDYSAATMLLGAMDTQSVPEPGTAISKALLASLSLFPDKGSRGKAVVLITDGEDHPGGEVQAAREAANEGVRIFCIGVGSRTGSPIPMRDSRGDLIEYKRDEAGESVISKLNEKTLQAIAALSDGMYHTSTPGQIELDSVLDAIDKMEKTPFGSREFSDAEERFQYFLLPGLLLIVLGTFLTDRQKQRRDDE